MFFQVIVTPQLAIHSFLIGDESSKRCAVIDPTRHVSPYIIAAQNNGFEITDILETHVHADFVSGACELKHELNGKPEIWASEAGGQAWFPRYADVAVRDRSELSLGPSITLKALCTPGHTHEHVSWLCYDKKRSTDIPRMIFTGDCLFAGSVGRPDLMGQAEQACLAEELYESLFKILAPFPDFVEIYPSHGSGSLCGKALEERESSTLGYERAFNPYLKIGDKKGWLKNLFVDLPPVPDYFSRVKKINASTPRLLNTLKVIYFDPESDPDVFSRLFLIDIRTPEAFAAGYLKGSLNIPLNVSFAGWAGRFLPASEPVGIVSETGQSASRAVEYLRLMGFDQDITVIEPRHFSKISERLVLLDPEALATNRKEQNSYSIIDVRTTSEWLSGHIPGSRHIELIDLEAASESVPSDKSIALICKSGARASLAASILQKRGIPGAANVKGGIIAWKAAGLPVISDES